MNAQSSTGIFTRGFIIGTAINFLLFLNYFILMTTMASYCMMSYTDDTSIAGLSASIFIVGALIARFIGGPLIDRIGRKRILVTSTLLITLLSACYLASFSLFTLMILRTLHGFCYGIAQTTITAVVTDLVPDEHKGEGIGYYMLSVTLGSAIGPFIGIFIIEHASFTVLFLTALGIGLLCFLCSLTVKSRKKPPAAVLALHLSPDTFLERKALPISTVVAFTYLAYGSLVTYLSAYATMLDLVVAASFFFIVYSLAMFITRPFTGKLFDKRGDLPVMISGFVSFVIGMAILSQATTAATLLISAAFCGYGVGSLQPSGLTLAIQRSPAERITIANSTYFIFLDIAIGIAPLALGWTIPFIGYRGMFLALIGVLAFAALLYGVFRKKHLL